MSVLYPTTMYVLYPPTHSKTKIFNQFLWFIMMGILCFFNYLQNQEIGWRVKRKKKSYLNGIAMMLMLMSTFLNLDQRFILFMLEGTNMERERNKNRSTEKQKIKQTS
jgi:peptidoglycan/LPS O-acetylase OafA/YrhL